MDNDDSVPDFVVLIVVLVVGALLIAAAWS